MVVFRKKIYVRRQVTQTDLTMRANCQCQLCCYARQEDARITVNSAATNVFESECAQINAAETEATEAWNGGGGGDTARDEESQASSCGQNVAKTADTDSNDNDCDQQVNVEKQSDTNDDGNGKLVMCQQTGGQQHSIRTGNRDRELGFATRPKEGAARCGRGRGNSRDGQKHLASQTIPGQTARRRKICSEQEKLCPKCRQGRTCNDASTESYNESIVRSNIEVESKKPIGNTPMENSSVSPVDIAGCCQEITLKRNREISKQDAIETKVMKITNNLSRKCLDKKLEGKSQRTLGRRRKLALSSEWTNQARAHQTYLESYDNFNESKHSRQTNVPNSDVTEIENDKESETRENDFKTGHSPTLELTLEKAVEKKMLNNDVDAAITDELDFVSSKQVAVKKNYFDFDLGQNFEQAFQNGNTDMLDIKDRVEVGLEMKCPCDVCRKRDEFLKQTEKVGVSSVRGRGVRPRRGRGARTSRRTRTSKNFSRVYKRRQNNDRAGHRGRGRGRGRGRDRGME